MDDLLTRGVVNIIPSKEKLEEELKSGKKLNIYLGIDPTATKIHLGHAVTLRKLQAFADAGHNVTFLIGDFTALIGDTSDKDSERPSLTTDEIAENFATYKEQASKILDFSKIEVKFNSEWLKELKFDDIIKLCQNFSFGDFASRELIKKRLSDGKFVGLHEALYPVMQGYDSHHLKTDLQIGGADQTFNMQAGRTLISKLDTRDSFVLATAYLTGTDGRKMSKSWGNAIWLSDTPEDMFRKVMSIDDSLIEEYATIGTRLTNSEVNELMGQVKDQPMKAKKKLALTIVSELHTQEDAEKAQAAFESTVQGDELPTDIPTLQLENEDLTITDVLVESGITESKSEAKRIIEQGGVELNGEKINQDTLVKEGMLKVGKHKYLKLSNAS